MLNGHYVAKTHRKKDEVPEWEADLTPSEKRLLDDLEHNINLCGRELVGLRQQRQKIVGRATNRCRYRKRIRAEAREQNERESCSAR